MSDIKPKRKPYLTTTLDELQKDRVEIERCRESPCYFYNRYIRKEGEKVLSEEEYAEYMKTVTASRNKPSTIAIEERLKQYPSLDNELMENEPTNKI